MALDQGEICAVGDCNRFDADDVVKAGGLAVAPGFIDVHTHHDWAVLQSPAMECKITQGVTTVIARNCRISAAPFTPRNGLPAPFGIVPGIAEHSFGSVEQYAKAVDLVAPAVNVMLLAGRSSLRAEVMGRYSDRASNGDEISQMAVLLNQLWRSVRAFFQVVWTPIHIPRAPRR
ncbi:MAG: amidohydrolase family protein [Pseudomonadota bacterium]